MIDKRIRMIDKEILFILTHVKAHNYLLTSAVRLESVTHYNITEHHIDFYN